MSGSLFHINDIRHESCEISSGERHTLDALAEALMKDEALERADVERIIQGSNESVLTRGRITLTGSNMIRHVRIEH